MYCPSCGSAATQGLTYCNRCGARLIASGENSETSSAVKPEMLIAAMVATFVFGLVAISALMGVLKVILQFDTGQIFPFAVVAFLMMILLEAVFITLLFWRRRPPERRDQAAPSPRSTNELDAAQAQFLPEARASVTEQTTRAFEPAYRDQTPK